MADKEKKQVPLRLSKTLYDELSRWAEDDFRSINGQIEYLLTECVKKRRKKPWFRKKGDTVGDIHTDGDFIPPSSEDPVDRK